MAKDYYAILGVGRDASEADIKKAFRKLAHQHHPDKAGGDTEKFKEINQAYQVLSDKEKRAQYDRFGQTFDGQGGGFDFGNFGGNTGGFRFDFGGAPFEDLFSEIFTGGFGGGGAEAGKGRDVGVDIDISFVEMARGTEKELSLRKLAPCRTCDGSGGAPGQASKTCATCQGTGQVKRSSQGIFGASFVRVTPCTDCHGRGKTYQKACPDCRGAGRVMATESVKVKIPAGLQDGATLAVRGAGEAGEYGGRSGDLLVTVHVSPHERFERRGEHVLLRQDISFAEAALGTSLSVETLEKPVTIKIPAGTQPGETFRLKGHGIERLGGYGRGDQLVVISVRVPKKLSREERQLVEKLREREL